MAGYGYTNRSGYNSYQGMEQPGYDNGYGSSDHLCRPVIIDAEGRKRPIISYNPINSESYVTKTERIVEHVHTPGMVSEYNYGSPTFVERPQRVQEFVTTVQTEVTRPLTSGPLSATHWRNTPNSAGYNGATGHNEHTNYNNNNDWNKPSGNTIRDDRSDDYHQNKPSGTTIRDNRFDNNYPRNENPIRGPKGWTTTPPSHETALSKPTNNIGAAVEILKEAAVTSAVNAVPPQARFMLPSSIVPKRDAYVETPKRDAYVETPKRDTYVETIDNKEAARRYGNFNLASRLAKTAENYTGTIDSSEAARKYKGSRV